ncbi:S8 family serine peptidase [Haloarchaeobius amylolyticus]|uniref:S8 family serine peptidase n=1 Tax=Haloarchaeobius amylolyticus TaxID=1198296 RepID=UPI002271380B|nr:S8 family serine peptidase [Haloarchaeobius amylolyticus]
MNRKLLAIALTGLMVVGGVAPFVGTTAAAPQATHGQTSVDGSVGAGSTVSETDTVRDTSAAPDDVWVSPRLERQFEQKDVVEVVVRLEEGSTRAATDRQSTMQTLKAHAAVTQREVASWANKHEGVRLSNSWWVTNAVLLEVRTDQVDLDELTRLDHVERLHTNFEVEAPEPRATGNAAEGPTTQNGYNASYALTQTNATEVWDQFGTMGGGAKVAVLDTGVAVDHPDIDLYTENASDPTYPGGWNEWNGDGEPVDSEPYASGPHGTHTSGIVAGGNASGTWIGVAPNVQLMHGGVLTDTGGTFAAIISGVEWAVEEDADVISMSLGCINTPCYIDGMIEPIQNAEDAGTIVIASSGNDGPGMSSSPGNVVEAVAIGATDRNASVTDFSSGMTVDTSDAWGDAAPDDWPEEYVVPDLAAPGNLVYSSIPEDQAIPGYPGCVEGSQYCELSGTSMSAPAVAGVVALMESAAGPGEVSNDDLRWALRDSAWKPEGEPSGNDTRYGAGIPNALQATELVALEQGVNGTVTEPDGDPIGGATVSVAGGLSTTTAADGSFSVIAQNGTHDVTADGFGYVPETRTVSVNGSYAVQNFTLDEQLAVRLQQGQPPAVQAGDNVTAVAQAANLESYTAELAAGYSEADATLYVNGNEVPWGQPVEFDQPTDVTATVTVETAPNTSGNVSVVHTFAGLNESVEATTGPTQVFEEFEQVGVVDDDDEYGPAVASTLDEELPANYQLTVISSDEAIANVDSYDTFVVQNIDPANGEAFAAATADITVGTVWLDNWGSDSNGIPTRSDAIGAPGTTGDGFGDGIVSYEATADHPILDGVVEPGETVQLHTATTFNDHSWFGQADSTVVADLHTADAGVKGAGLAVDGERWDVLASSLGREIFVTDEQFTEEADQILANSVLFASDTPEPAGTVDVTETTVQPDGTATVTVWTDTLDDLSGYQARLDYDPDKLSVVDVTGKDMPDPVTNVDEQNGTIYMAQAVADGVDDPQFVEVEFEVLMDDYGQEADVTWDRGSSLVTYENGTSPLVSWTPGAVSTADGMLGDVNMDGELTVQDATLVQQYIVGDLPPGATFNEDLADVNQDGAITSADVTLILEEIVDEQLTATVDTTVTAIDVSALAARA